MACDRRRAAAAAAAAAPRRRRPLSLAQLCCVAAAFALALALGGGGGMGAVIRGARATHNGPNCPRGGTNAQPAALASTPAVCAHYEPLACCSLSEAAGELKTFLDRETARFSNAECRSMLEDLWCGFACSGVQERYVTGPCYAVCEDYCAELYGACRKGEFDDAPVALRWPSAAAFCEGAPRYDGALVNVTGTGGCNARCFWGRETERRTASVVYGAGTGGGLTTTTHALTVQAVNDLGIVLQRGGDALDFSVDGPNRRDAGPTVVDNGNGLYDVSYEASIGGLYTIDGTLNGDRPCVLPAERVSVTKASLCPVTGRRSARPAPPHPAASRCARYNDNSCCARAADYAYVEQQQRDFAAIFGAAPRCVELFERMSCALMCAPRQPIWLQPIANSTVWEFAVCEPFCASLYDACRDVVLPSGVAVRQLSARAFCESNSPSDTIGLRVRDDQAAAAAAMRADECALDVLCYNDTVARRSCRDSFVFGDGLYDWRSGAAGRPLTAGVTHQFTITAVDEYQNALGVGGHSWIVEFERGGVVPAVTDNGDGTYDVRWSSTDVGELCFAVKCVDCYCTNGRPQHVEHSPLCVTQVPDEPLVEFQCQNETARNAEPYHFYITLRDQYGNPVVDGGGLEFTASVDVTGGDSRPVFEDVRIEQRCDGQYRGTLVPDCGIHTVTVRFANGTVLGTCQFELSCTPAPTPAPSVSPTSLPTASPTTNPPTPSPTDAPTPSPTTVHPTPAPTLSPTRAPASSMPTPSPSATPTATPSAAPSPSPTASPSASPSPAPTAAPTFSPTPTPGCPRLVQADPSFAAVPLVENRMVLRTEPNDTHCYPLAFSVYAFLPFEGAPNAVRYDLDHVTPLTHTCNMDGTHTLLFTPGFASGATIEANVSRGFGGGPGDVCATFFFPLRPANCTLDCGEGGICLRNATTRLDECRCATPRYVPCTQLDPPPLTDEYCCPVPPAFGAIRFADDPSTSIVVDFSLETDRAGMVGEANCSIVLDTDAMESLGDDAFCVWNDDATLVIWLGGNATIAVGDSVVVRRNVLYDANGGAAIAEDRARFARIDPPVHVPLPQPVVSAPHFVNPCLPLVLDGSLSYGFGGRDGVWTWTLLDNEAPPGGGAPPPLPNRAAIQAFLDAQRGPVVRFDAATQALLAPTTEYRFEATATNHFGVRTAPPAHVTSVIIENAATDTAKAVPHVRVQAARANVTAADALKLEALVDVPPPPGATCADGSPASALRPLDPRLAYSWKSVPAFDMSSRRGVPLVLTADRALYVPRHRLVPGTAYTFTVTVHYVDNPGIETSADAVVHVRRSPLEPVIDGGERLATRGEGAVYTFNATRTHDPDVDERDVAAGAVPPPPPLLYQWAIEAPSGAPASGFTPPAPVAGATAAQLDVDIDALAAGDGLGTYRVVLTVSDDAMGGGGGGGALPPRTASASVGLLVVAPPAGGAAGDVRPRVSIDRRPPRGLFDPSERLVLEGFVEPASVSPGDAIEYRWSTERGVFPLASNRDRLDVPDERRVSLVVKGNSLAIGSTYVFRLTARNTRTGLSGYAEVIVTADIRPTAGTCDVVADAADTRLFTLTCTNFDDFSTDRPLTFRAYRRAPDATSDIDDFPLNVAPTSANTFQFRLPPGEHDVRVDIADRHGATTRYFVRGVRAGDATLADAQAALVAAQQSNDAQQLLNAFDLVARLLAERQARLDAAAAAAAGGGVMRRRKRQDGGGGDEAFEVDLFADEAAQLTADVLVSAIVEAELEFSPFIVRTRLLMLTHALRVPGLTRVGLTLLTKHLDVVALSVEEHSATSETVRLSVIVSGRAVTLGLAPPPADDDDDDDTDADADADGMPATATMVPTASGNATAPPAAPPTAAGEEAVAPNTALEWRSSDARAVRSLLEALGAATVRDVAAQEFVRDWRDEDDAVWLQVRKEVSNEPVPRLEVSIVNGAEVAFDVPRALVDRLSADGSRDVAFVTRVVRPPIFAYSPEPDAHVYTLNKLNGFYAYDQQGNPVRSALIDGSGSDSGSGDGDGDGDSTPMMGAIGRRRRRKRQDGGGDDPDAVDGGGDGAMSDADQAQRLRVSLTPQRNVRFLDLASTRGVCYAFSAGRYETATCRPAGPLTDNLVLTCVCDAVNLDYAGSFAGFGETVLPSGNALPGTELGRIAHVETSFFPPYIWALLLVLLWIWLAVCCTGLIILYHRRRRLTEHDTLTPYLDRAAGVGVLAALGADVGDVSDSSELERRDYALPTTGYEIPDETISSDLRRDDYSWGLPGETVSSSFSSGYELERSESASPAELYRSEASGSELARTQSRSGSELGRSESRSSSELGRTESRTGSGSVSEVGRDSRIHRRRDESSGGSRS